MKRKCHKYKEDTPKKKESHYINIATYICFLSFCQPWHWPDPWICHYFNNGALTGEISSSTNSIAPSKNVLFCLLYKPLTKKKLRHCHSFMALNEASDILAADWLSQTWKIIIIFRVWWYGRFFSIVEILLKHYSLCNSVTIIIIINFAGRDIWFGQIERN